MREWGGDRKWVEGGLKARVGWERCIGQNGQMDQLYSGNIQGGGARKGRHNVGSCGISKRKQGCSQDSSRSKSYQEF